MFIVNPTDVCVCHIICKHLLTVLNDLIVCNVYTVYHYSIVIKEIENCLRKDSHLSFIEDGTIDEHIVTIR